MSRKIEDFRQLQAAQHKWALGKFPSQTAQSKIKHLIREANELLEHPQDKSEMADILLLLLNVASMAQVDANMLFEAAVAKHRINESREWGEPDADGICHHKKEHTT